MFVLSFFLKKPFRKCARSYDSNVMVTHESHKIGDTATPFPLVMDKGKINSLSKQGYSRSYYAECCP